MKHYLIKVTKIEKDNFSFYGNDCRYYLDIFNDKKIKVGVALAPVVQQGTDYSSAYEYLYDFDLQDEDDRAALAESLGVDSISDEWLDDDGQIDSKNLPQEIIKRIEESEDESLIDWYYEEYSEYADQEGYMLLADFADHYKVRSSYGSLMDKYGEIVSLNPDSPLTEIFEENEINGWYKPHQLDLSKIQRSEPDILGKDKAMFVKMAALIAEQLDDMDMVSSLVNIRYAGDYSREAEAKEKMNYIYVEIAYIVIRSVKPLIDYQDDITWKNLLTIIINQIGVNLGFLYEDNDATEFDSLADMVYDYLVDSTIKQDFNETYCDGYETLIDSLLEAKVYPQTISKYTELLKRLNLADIQ